jgi:GTP-binding protein
VDARIPPQQLDLDFMEWLGDSRLPFVIALTKVDKVSRKEKSKHLKALKEALSEEWEELPVIFETSARDGQGRDEILQFISDTNRKVSGSK